MAIVCTFLERGLGLKLNDLLSAVDSQQVKVDGYDL